jgi:hypothetical protein
VQATPDADALDPVVEAALVELAFDAFGCGDFRLRVGVHDDSLLVLAPAGTDLPRTTQPETACGFYLSLLAPAGIDRWPRDDWLPVGWQGGSAPTDRQAVARSVAQAFDPGVSWPRPPEELVRRFYSQGSFVRQRLGKCGLDGRARVVEASGRPLLLVRDEAVTAEVDECLRWVNTLPVRNAEAWPGADWMPYRWTTTYDEPGIREREESVLAEIAAIVERRPE